MSAEPAAPPLEPCRVCGSADRAVVTRDIRDWEYGVEGAWDYARCGACGIVEITPFPSLDDLVRAYDVDYHGYRTSTEKGRVYRMLFEVKDALYKRKIARLVPKGAALLDVGCGTGAYLTRMDFLEPSRLDGIDFNGKAARLARERGVDCFQGVFGDFEAEPGTYDAVFMNNYLEHTTDPAMEAEKALRLLKPGGVLMGEVPNFRSVDRALFGRYWGGNHVPRHTFQFSPASIRGLLERAGFADVSTNQELSSNHLTLSIQNWLQRGADDLAKNPKIKKGRAPYYNALLLATAPINLLFKLAGRSGVMKFSAMKRA